jgi:hypothetical protein
METAPRIARRPRLQVGENRSEGGANDLGSRQTPRSRPEMQRRAERPGAAGNIDGTQYSEESCGLSLPGRGMTALSPAALPEASTDRRFNLPRTGVSSKDQVPHAPRVPADLFRSTCPPRTRIAADASLPAQPAHLRPTFAQSEIVKNCSHEHLFDAVRFCAALVPAA